jgi:hypothetical protein
MKRILSAVVVAVSVWALAGAAFAYMGPGRMGMGPGWMAGARMMGARAGVVEGPGASGVCPGMAAAGQAGAPATLGEAEAKARVEEYVKQYLPGFTVERVLPVTGRRMRAYQVELKGEKGETRTVHVNPWGNVMPFPGPMAR